MRLGNLLEIASTNALSNVLIFMGCARLLQASRGKELQNEKQLYTIFPGRRRLRAWGPKEPMLCLHAVPAEDGIPIEDEDESGMKLCTSWGKIFDSRAEDKRHHAHETILEYVQKTPEDVQWEIDKREIDEMISTKKESAPGPDGIPYSYLQMCGWVRDLSLPLSTTMVSL